MGGIYLLPYLPVLWLSFRYRTIRIDSIRAFGLKIKKIMFAVRFGVHFTIFSPEIFVEITTIRAFGICRSPVTPAAGRVSHGKPTMYPGLVMKNGLQFGIV